MLIFNYLILPFSLLVTEFQGLLKSEPETFQEIRINPRAALSQEVFAEDVFEQVNYIPLQTNKESGFGKIDQLEATAEYFFILDQNHRQTTSKASSAILVFKRSGEFYSKINTVQTFFFSLNRYKEEVVVLDLLTQSNLIYNYNGKLIRTEPKDFFVAAFAYTSPSTILNYRQGIVDENSSEKAGNFANCDLIFTDSSKNILDGFFPFDTTSISGQEIKGGSSLFFSQSGNDVFFHRPYFGDFYRISGNKLKPAYRFILPLLNTLPVNFGKDKKYLNKRLDHLKNHPDQVYDITNFFQSADVLSFKLCSEKTKFSFLYHLKNKNLIELSSIQTDDLLLAPLNENILASDGVHLVTFTTAITLAGSQKKDTDKHKIPPNLQKILQTASSAESNPILVLLKPRI